LRLAPSRARRLGADGGETEVAVAELRPGDLVALPPGASVPTDGEVVAGDSALDESMLTGESVPAEKACGSRLCAGTLNLNRRLVMRVTATGEQTALAHIIAAVQRAQSSRARIQRLGDRVSSVFVPLVVVVALAAGLWWGLAFDSAHAAHAWLGRFLWATEPPGAPAAAAWMVAAAVLIVACPCALGLATPAAIMAAANAAARRGILIRDGLALEKAGRISAVLFDKTGTLTTGKLEVTAVAELAGPSPEGERHGSGPATDSPPATGQSSEFKVQSSGLRVQSSELTVPSSEFKVQRSALSVQSSEPEVQSSAFKVQSSELSVQALAVSLARHSTHPVSQAVARLPASPLGLADWEEVRGAGVQGRLRLDPIVDSPLHPPSSVLHPPSSPSPPWPSRLPPGAPAASASGDLARLGSLRWLHACGVDLAPGRAFIEEWSAQGATIVGLARGPALVGLFAVRDTLKPGAREVIDLLHRQRLKTWLVTGDQTPTALSIARQAGIPEEKVCAEARPEQKAELVRCLQRQGLRVAFVGDGINDAPGLEAADLGVAVSRAADIAREAADIVLLKSEIHAVPESLGLARAALRAIKQNLFWAFFYNAAAVPLAALGFLSPILCAAAMGLSDLVVIGNALRLARWRS
jgi:cation transport ATPase